MDGGTRALIPGGVVRRIRRLIGVGVLLCPSAAAQEVSVYSEFRRVDPFGEIVPQDRGGRPREILSPLVARNSHLTLHVVVETPPGKHSYLYAGSNPENVLEISVFKEMFSRAGDSWVPDLLVPVTLPYLGHVPDRYHAIPNQKVECFLLDVLIPRDRPPGRLRLEVQLSIEGRWLIYPMELRVSDVTVPAHRWKPSALSSIQAPADRAALGPLREYLCGEPEAGMDGRDTIRQIIRRNALEDMAVAREKEKELGKEAVATNLLRALKLEREAFCGAAEIRSEFGPEWYLRARDFLYRGKLDY